MRRLTAMIALGLCLNASAPARAAMYVIDNPAGKISNPADNMNNPASQSNNPAANIYNPGARMDNRNPLSPPTKAVESTVSAASAAAPAAQERQRYQPEIPQKKYYYQTAGAYIRAAKKSFIKDDYVEFLSITEDALRRINAGTLKASANTRHKLNQYRVFGHGMLE
jgi:hypothetical protein